MDLCRPLGVPPPPGQSSLLVADPIDAAVHLAGAGIGRLLLIDYDVVEERNLNRQFMYTSGDRGKEKCRVLAEKLRAYAPETEIEFYSGKYEPGIDENCDITVIAVDNIKTRSQVNSACVSYGRPCVNGSINGFFGTAYLYLPGKTPDLGAAGCLNETGHGNLSPSSTAAIIGAYEAKLAIDYFLGNYNSAGKLYIYDNNEIQSLIIRGEKND